MLEIIHLMGGVTALANRLGLAKQTVGNWNTNGRIPRWHRQAIIAAAKEYGIEITPQMLSEAFPNGKQSAPPTADAA